MPDYQLSKKDMVFGLIALGVGILGLFGSFFLVLRQVDFSGQSAPGEVPQQVKLTNLTENSASISWVTNDTASGAVVYGVRQDLESNMTTFDDRGGNITSLLHHATLKNLKPGSAYYFRIVSGSSTFDNQGKPYVFSTPQHSSLTPLPPAIIKGRADKEALVYFSFRNSLPVSSLSDEKGYFLVTINNALNSDQQSFHSVQNGEKGYLFFQYDKGSDTQEVIVTGEETTIEAIKPAGLPIENPRSLESQLPAAAEVSPTSSFFQRIIDYLQSLLGLSDEN